MKKIHIIALAVLALFVTAPGYASDTKGSHSSHDHSAMKAPEGKTEAKAVGIINKVDTEKNSINVTHEPVKELGWPKMTMDLPVTKRVDLSKVKTGKEVEFTLKKGRDKQYRVIEINEKK